MTSVQGRMLSFSTRIALVFGGVLLVAMGGLVLLWYFGLPQLDLAGARTHRLNAALRLLEVDANQQRAAISQNIEERRGGILIVSENRVIAALLEKGGNLQADVERVFDRLQRAYPDRFSSLQIIDPASGRIRGSSESSDVGKVFSPAALLARASQPGAVELIEQIDGPFGPTLVLVRQMHAPEPDGTPGEKLAGIVVAYLDLAQLAQRGDLVAQVGSGLPGKLALFGADGRLLHHLPAGSAVTGLADKYAQVSRGFEGTLITSDSSGRETIAVYRHLPLSGAQSWSLMHYLDKDEALVGLKGQAQSIVLAGVLFTFLGLLLIVFFARRTTRPLRQLAGVAKQFGGGELAVRASLPDNDSREIAELADAFNGMANSVELAHRELESKVVARTVELAQERDAAQRYLDIAGVMLLALNRDGRIAMINRKGAEILGRPEGELIGMDWIAHFLPPEVRSGVAEVFGRIMNDELAGVGYYENRIITTSGKVIVMAWNNAILRDDQGAPTGTLSSGEDITERKQAEETLRLLNIELESRVVKRTSQLAETNASLQKTLERLQQTQTELVQREKLASLGALVAGVAHELNTPLGNGVTVSTTLIDDLAVFSADFNGNALTKTRLRDFIEHTTHGMTLLQRSLERANTLVGNFKRVATDQSSEIWRQFDLAEVVNDVVATINPQFKHTPHCVRVDIPPGIILDSFPGPLGQVVTNLALNSLVHGFSNNMQGEVCFSVESMDDDRVVLRVSDNGCGIQVENLSRVFDPFFTTRLGQGGSGLGLHIVFNLVTTTLGGEIRVDSAPGKGAVFTIDLPRVLPAPVEGSVVPGKASTRLP